MNTATSVLSHMSESALLDHFETLVARDRRTTTQLLVAIAEIDERKVWARHACPSMFAFCVERFHMSEQVTAKRIWAARTARRFPSVLGMVERGELNLAAIHVLARHLTPDNCRDVLERVSYVLGIYKALQILLPDERAADAWVHQPNTAPLFAGRPALDRMLSGNVADLFVVRSYLDAQRGWQ